MAPTHRFSSGRDRSVRSVTELRISGGRIEKIRGQWGPSARRLLSEGRALYYHSQADLAALV